MARVHPHAFANRSCLVNDTNARPAGESPDRLLRVQKVVDACIERRIGGDALPDEQIIAEHPDLLPELRDELGNLAVIERARRRAASSDVRFGTTVAARGQSGAEAGPPDFFPGFEILEMPLSPNRLFELVSQRRAQGDFG